MQPGKQLLILFFFLCCIVVFHGSPRVSCLVGMNRNYLTFLPRYIFGLSASEHRCWSIKGIFCLASWCMSLSLGLGGRVDGHGLSDGLTFRLYISFNIITVMPSGLIPREKYLTEFEVYLGTYHPFWTENRSGVVI